MDHQNNVAQLKPLGWWNTRNINFVMISIHTRTHNKQQKTRIQNSNIFLVALFWNFFLAICRNFHFSSKISFSSSSPSSSSASAAACYFVSLLRRKELANFYHNGVNVANFGATIARLVYAKFSWTTTEHPTECNQNIFRNIDVFFLLLLSSIWLLICFAYLFTF